MYRWMFALCLLGSALVLPAFAQQEAAPAPAAEPSAEVKAKIAAAIKDLGADAFETRQAGQAELLKIGLPAEVAVRAAAGSPDPEVAGRAKTVLTEFERRKLDVVADKVTWATVLERVKHHAANKEWEKPGFADPLLERAVEKVIEQANAAANEDRVQLPVRFGDVTTVAGGLRRAGQLVVAQGSSEHSFCERSIFLVDGSVRIAHCSNCLIIARGAVTIAHGSGNIVLAGQFVDISHDGSALRRAAAAGGAAPMAGGSSLVMSGGVLRISNANRTVCSSPGEVSVGAEDSIFLNCTNQVDGGRRVANKSIDKVPLQLQPVAPPNPIRDQLKITQVVDYGSSRGFIVVDHGGVEVVVRHGAEIKDNLGKPLAALAGWKLAFAADGYALLSNGKEDAGFVLPRGE